jgi:hypothetical protein
MGWYVDFEGRVFEDDGTLIEDPNSEDEEEVPE